MIALISITALASAVVVLALAYGSLVAEHRRLEDVHDALLRELETKEKQS
jgi:hypothetical protein